MNEKHVFSELVTDFNNPEHLIAYALYKHNKHNLAVGLIAENKSLEEIESRLETEKQNTLSNSVALQKYRDDAAIYLSKTLEGATKKIKQEYDEQKAKDKKAITDEAKKIQNQWLKKVDAQRVADAKAKNLERFLFGLNWIKNQFLAHIFKVLFAIAVGTLGITGQLAKLGEILNKKVTFEKTEINQTINQSDSSSSKKKAAE